MGKYFSLLSLIGVFLIFTSTACHKDEPSSVKVDPSSINAEVSENQYSISVESNSDWTVTCDADWVKIMPSTGSGKGNVVVTVSANKTPNEKKTSIIFTTTDGKANSIVSVTQKALNENLSTDVSSIVFSSDEGVQQSLNIRSNCDWKITDLPEWLLVSSDAGNGNSYITIKTKSSNDSSTPREGCFKISSVTQSLTINVKQEAGLASCTVRPQNITALYYGVAFDLWYSKNVATCKVLMLSDYDYKHLTEREVLTLIEAEESDIPDDNTLYSRGCTEETKYHILALAYDSKGNRGEIVDEIFTSPKYYNATDDAWCSFSDATYNNTSFTFTVVKEGRCSKYNVIYGANIYPGYMNRLFMAFEMNYYIKNKKKHWFAENWNLQIETDYPNNHQFQCPLSMTNTYGGIFAAARGIFSDGTLSSDVTMISGDIFADQVFGINKKNDKEVEYYRNLKGWEKTKPINK